MSELNVGRHPSPMKADRGPGPSPTGPAGHQGATAPSALGSVAERLGAFVADAAPQPEGSPVRRQAQRALLNMLAASLQAAKLPAVSIPVDVLAPFSGEDRVSLIGRPERLDVLGASFVNALCANLLDFDDTHFPTAIHPGAPCAAPALAVAERHGIGGAALLDAIALGIEVCCRIGLGVSPGHYARGWHITSTCGVFGAAAATARLLRLSAEETAAALGLASSQSAGTVENLPTAGKNVSVGGAARAGVLCALLAQKGYRAAPLAIEGRLGWARAMGDAPDARAMAAALGERWELLDVAFKPYPAGFVFHAVIDACLDLRTRLDLSAEDIVDVLVEGDQLLLDRGDRDVASGRDTRVSIAHAAAISFVRGRAGTAEFTDKAASDPLLSGFRKRVRWGLASELPTAAARVTVALRDGRRETAEVVAARGSPKKPLSDRELEVKLTEAAQSAGRADQASAIIREVWALESAPNVDALMHCVSGHD